MKKRKFIQEDLNNNSDIYNFEKGISSKKTSEDEHNEYSDHIYVAESNSKEFLFDRNNPIVKIILIGLGLVALIGSIYYILTGIGII